VAMTPGQTAVTGGTNGTRTRPRPVMPQVELPDSDEVLAKEAAAQLGWHGEVLPRMTLLGRRVFVVARIRTVAHAERIATGAGPVTDRTTVATWAWPELARTAPPVAAEIVGVIGVARHWRTGLASVVPFARYGQAAMVLPQSAVLTADYVDNCLPRARVYGVGVLAADEQALVEMDLAARTDRMVLEPDAVSRWVQEMAYEQLLACAEVPASVD
jgi:hypothetical protein